MHEMRAECLLCSVWALADFWAWKVNVLAVALWGIQFFWLKFLSTVALNIQVTACPVHERRGLFPIFWDTCDARCFSLVHLEISFFSFSFLDLNSKSTFLLSARPYLALSDLVIACKFWVGPWHRIGMNDVAGRYLLSVTKNWRTFLRSGAQKLPNILQIPQ